MKRRTFLTTLPASTVMLHPALQAQQPSAKRAAGTVRLLIGTSGHGSRGIYASYLHNGTLSQPRLIAEATNPAFLAIPDPSSPFMFAVTQPEDFESHASSFSHEPMTDTGTETFTSHGDASSGSPGGCHVSVTRDGRCVFVANYGGASVASFLVSPEGKVALASLIKFPSAGHGPNPERQKQSYAHSAVPSPDENYLLVNDLGLDCIHIFRIDHGTAKITPHDEWKAAPGSGPRHIVRHGNGKWIYSINELTNMIDQLAWDPAVGKLTTLSHASTLPPGTDPANKRACEMALSHDNRFLYAANRIYEDFAVFSIDAATGKLTAIQHLANPGKEARHITIDPSGRYLVSADQFSNDVSVFPIDPNTGKLSPRIGIIALNAPSCVLFA